MKEYNSKKASENINYLMPSINVVSVKVRRAVLEGSGDAGGIIPGQNED